MTQTEPTGYPFPLDHFQLQAIACIEAGSNVVVAAPTGSGKTVVAEHALTRALEAGRRAFYTTPLKALSNQKYFDLVDRHGTEAVGLLTGDNVIRPSAPVVVMTTEVLRNMIYSQSSALDDVEFVILDEVHFLQDAYRGSVWEEVIIHSPARVRLVCLSATVSNAEELTDWIRTVRGSTAAVVELHRPVELVHHYLLSPHRGSRPAMVDILTPGGSANPEAARLDATSRQVVSGLAGGGTRPPRRTEVVEVLAGADMLPAIYFIFSRAGCDDAVRSCREAGLRLTTTGEAAEIRKFTEEAGTVLSEADRSALGYAAWASALEAGIASHHAGMVPPFKLAVERAFARGLVKVVFATETLALGVNMPARAVVIEKMSKFTGEGHDFLTPAEYTQLTGRAGRRGIDALGHAVVLWSPYVRFDRIATLASTRNFDLRSSFRPTYNMAANLVPLFDRERAQQLLNLSFAQYQADRRLVGMQAHLDAERLLLDRVGEEAGCSRGDVDEYRHLARALADIETARTGREAVAEAMALVRPGDILSLGGGKSGGRVAVVSVAHRRGGEVRIGAVTPARRYLNLTPRDFDDPPARVGRLKLPAPYAPRSPKFQRSVATALGRARTAPAPTNSPGADRGRRTGTGKRDDEARRVLESHPVHACERRHQHLAAADRRDTLMRSIAGLRSRLDHTADSLAGAFDRIVSVLEAWGYVADWTLTADGDRLRRIYHECDLLVAEAVGTGAFDGLDPATLAGLASTFVYEPRRPARGPGPGRRRGGPRNPKPEAADPKGLPNEVWFPSTVARSRWEQVSTIAVELAALETGIGVPRTRPPHPGFFAATFRWASGENLAPVIGSEEITGGDFVRTMRQVIDLVRQLATVCHDPETSATAALAARRLDRGLVAASAIGGVPAQASSAPPAEKDR